MNEPSQHSPTNHYATMRIGRAIWLGMVAQPAVEPGLVEAGYHKKKWRVLGHIFFFFRRLASLTAYATRKIFEMAFVSPNTPNSFRKKIGKFFSIRSLWLGMVHTVFFSGLSLGGFLITFSTNCDEPPNFPLLFFNGSISG